MLWALVLLGAECSPSEPGCGADDCGADEVGQCINFCAPIATPEEVAGGRVLCPLDPCDEAAVTLPDAFVCPTSFRCAPRALLPGDDPRLGFCAAALRTQYGLECEAVGDCGEGLVCRKGGSVEALALANLMGREPFDNGVCLPPVRESGACDSNLADALIVTPVDLPAAPCEHGTFCMPGALGGLDTDENRCIRPCGVDGEADHTVCGCDETLCVERGEFVREATGESLGAHFCIPCTANREECTSVDRCCDEQAGATCMPAPRFGVLVDEGEIDQCCRPEEAECEVDSECCHGSLLFSQDLTSGVSGGFSAFLPQDNGGPVHDLSVLGADQYESVRAFDAGACSYVASYQLLAEAVGASLVTQLASIEEVSSSIEIDELSVGRIAVTPILRSTPRYPLTASIGPEEPLDGLLLDIALSVDARAQGPLEVIKHDCETSTLSLRPTIDFTVTDSFQVPPGTRSRDAELRSVGCNLRTDSSYTCTLPNPVDPALPVVQERFSGCPSGLDPYACHRQMMGIGCEINTNTYGCSGPVPLHYDGNPLSIEDFPGPLITLVIPREVDVVAHAKDLVVDIRLPDDAMDFNSPNDACNLARGQVKDQIRRAAARAEGALADQIADLVGTIVGGPTIGNNRLRATRDFGIPAATIPTCSNDDDCHRTTFLGDRRHRCDSAAGICDFVRMEFRRIHFRPDGIEIVLAENATDPHFALLDDGRTGPSIVPLDVPPALCASNRFANDDGMLRIQALTPTLALLANGRLCQEDEVDCPDLCPSLGISCANAAGRDPALAGSTCNSGECCLSGADCTGTGRCACGGSCTDLSRDASHCGACGIACGPGFRCIGGSCALP